MSAFDTLIRVARHQSEEQQKIVAEITDARMAMEADRNRITALIEEEKGKLPADASIVERAAFATYAREMKVKTEELAVAIEGKAAEEDAAREVLREAFAEMKKLELLVEREATRVRAEEAKRETNLLDEIAVTRSIAS